MADTDADRGHDSSRCCAPVTRPAGSASRFVDLPRKGSHPCIERGCRLLPCPAAAEDRARAPARGVVSVRRKNRRPSSKITVAETSAPGGERYGDAAVTTVLFGSLNTSCSATVRDSSLPRPRSKCDRHLQTWPRNPGLPPRGSRMRRRLALRATSTRWSPSPMVPSGRRRDREGTRKIATAVQVSGRHAA